MGTQTEDLLPSLVSYPTNICTLQDVILDSPVWRSNIEQLQDQIEIFEKWLEGFIRVLKHYIEAVTRVNSQTTHLCKHLNLDNMDNSLIDFQIVGTVINAFQDNLQCNLTAKTKLANDLLEALLKPLQDLLKVDIKEFKDMRKTYEKVLDKYENYLCRYSVLSKQKEPSALREDAFQLFDVQKSYIHTSGDYFILLITLKSKMEHTLVDCFSSGVIDHMDALNTSMQSSNSVKTMISGWRQWLDESQKSSKYLLDRIKKSSHILEDAHLKQIKPHRSLKRYSTSNNDLLVAISNSSTATSLIDDHNNDNSLNASNNDPNMESNTSLVSSSSQGETVNNGDEINPSSSSTIVPEKHGYLFSRTIVGKPNRYSWVRRWFFLKDGWLGQYTLSTINKVKGCLVIGDRIQVSTCESNIYTDTDRRFCFEIKGEKCSFVLQAENEKDMHKWLWTIEKAKEYALNHNGTETFTINNDNEDTPHILLSPFANESIHKPLDVSSQALVSLSVLPPTLDTLSNFNTATLTKDYLDPKTSTMASITKLLLEEHIKERLIYEKSNNHDNDDDDKDDIASIISIPPPLPDKTSSAETANNNSNNNNNNNPDSPLPRRLITSSSTTTASSSSSNSPWSVPWLISGITSLSSNTDETIDMNGWIFKSNNNNEPDFHIIWPNKVECIIPDITLENYSEDLKSKNRELRKYFSNVSQDEIVYNVFTASIYNQQVDQSDSSIELDNNNVKGKGYSGTAYVTQKNIWFYSCKLLSCVNAIVIPLKNIKSIRLEKILSTNSQGMLMKIDTITEPSFTYGLWLDAAELIGEKLRILIEYAKGSLKLDEQTLFDTINNLSIKKLKSKTPTSHLTVNTTPDISVTPLTVQAYSNTYLERRSSLESLSDNDHAPSSATSTASETNINQESLENNHPISCSPATGALTAAMEAANEALNKAKLQKGIATKSSSSSSSNANTPNRTVTPPPPHIPSNTMTRKKSTSSSSTHKKNITHDEKVTLKTKKDRHRSSTKPLPSDPVQCECEDHLEKEEARVELTMSAQALFQYMFENDKDKTFLEKLHQEKGNSALNISEWKVNTDGKKERTLTYLMPVNNPMVKVKEAEVIETQEIQKEVDGLCYVVIITTKTPMLPYADAFIPTIKLCITYNTSNSCNFRCSTGVKWLKSIMVKGMVNRAAFKGMTETISALLKIVEVAAAQKNIPEDNDQQQKNNMITKKQKSIKREVSTNLTSDQMLQKENQSNPYQKWKKILVQPYNLSGTLLSPPWLLGYCLLGIALLLVTFIFNYTDNNNNLLSFLPSFITRNNQTISRYDQHHDHHQSSTISWRAVYINDLDTIVYGNDFKLENKSNSRAYELFKKSRKDIVGWKYRWFNVRHKLMATEMTYTREQIAALRYELLTAFKLLNGMEQQLLQSEYWNWLLDQKLRCGCHQEDNQLLKLCIDVNNELEQLE